MIRPPVTSRCCLAPARAFRHGFTLVELLTVMAIMLILAGLILSIAGNANYKGSLSRAQTEIKQMETAMESYKVDNGAYPRDSIATDTLNAQNVQSSGNGDPAAGVASSKFLYRELSGIDTTAALPKKAYVAFLPSQLYPANTTPVSGTTYIIDPFGFSYGYSTVNLAVQETINGGGTGDLTTAGYNPTFDFWSTAGYGPAGKSYPATSSLATNQRNTLWVKNW